MKNKKILPLFLTLTLTFSLFLSGCVEKSTPSDFAQTHVQGTLDAIYKGQYNKEFSEVSTITKEDAEEMYLDNLKLEADFFAYFFDVTELSDKSMDALVEFYKKVYQKTKYEVHHSLEDGDDFLVDVYVHPIDIISKFYEEEFDTVIADFNARYNAGEFDYLSKEKYEDEYVRTLLEALEPMIDTIDYLEMQTVTFKMVKDPEDGLYFIEDEMAADSYMINYFL